MRTSTQTYRLVAAAGTTNATEVKPVPGYIFGVQGVNVSAAAVYLKLYDKASAPTVGTDSPRKTIYLPAETAFALDFPESLTFNTGIAFALTGAAADADTTALSAGDVVCLNIDYQ